MSEVPDPTGGWAKATEATAMRSEPYPPQTLARRSQSGDRPPGQVASRDESNGVIVCATLRLVGELAGIGQRNESHGLVAIGRPRAKKIVDRVVTARRSDVPFVLALDDDA
jgi:hypothetical protein